MYDEFAAFLATRLRERKVSVRHVAEATGIPERALAQLLSGAPTDLPATPYIHGYIMKLGDTLGFDGDAWWQQLKRSGTGTSSGTGDLLPRNRYSRNRIPGWVLWGAPLALALLAFLGFRFAAIVGLPDVAVTAPDRDGVVLTEDATSLSGTATPGSRVTVNGEAVSLTDDGRWEREVRLQPGVPNDFAVEATKFLGRSRTASRRIFFVPPAVSTSTPETATSTATSTVTSTPGATSTPTSTIIEF